MRMNYGAAAVAMAVFVGLMAGGCCATDKCETSGRFECQQREIERLSDRVETNSMLLETMLERENEEEQDQQSQQLAAAIFLATSGNQSIQHLAVNIIGQIGGEAAEMVLLEMADNPQLFNSVVNALAGMRSVKLRELLAKYLENSDLQRMTAVVGAYSNHMQMSKKDLPLMLTALDTIPSGHNSRYLRNSIISAIFRMDQEKGMEVLCEELDATCDVNVKRELLNVVNNHNINLGFHDWQKLIESAGISVSGNPDMLQSMAYAIQRSGDWRLTDILLEWMPLARTNDRFRNTLISVLIQMRDPKAASSILELIKLPSGTRPHGLDNFPGIVGKNGEYVLADADSMKRLLSERERSLAKLAEREERLRKRRKADDK